MTRRQDSDEREEPQFGYDEHRKEPYFEDVRPKAKKQTSRTRRQRSLLPVFLVGAIVILFVGFLAISYLKGPKLVAGQLPVITADLSPIKIKPDKTDDAAIPFQNTTVYDDLDKNRQKHAATEVEHLLQAPEQPLPMPGPAPSTETISAGRADLPPPNGGGRETYGAAISRMGEGVPQSETPPQPTPSPQPSPMREREIPDKTNDAALAPAEPSVAQPAETVPPPPLPPAKPVQATAKPPATVAVASGTAIIQLGSFHDEAGARSEWQRLRARHADQLSALSPMVQYVDLGDKGIWYRLRAGPLSADKAKAACAELQAVKAPCIVSGQK